MKSGSSFAILKDISVILNSITKKTTLKSEYETKIKKIL